MAHGFTGGDLKRLCKKGEKSLSSRLLLFLILIYTPKKQYVLTLVCFQLRTWQVRD